LTFARKTGVERRSISVNELVREVARLMEETLPRMIEMDLALMPGLPSISGDMSQLHQVIVNLCVNSRDAMPSGGKLTLATEMVSGEVLKRTIERASAESYVCVIVKDEGEGMDEETRKRIFEPFFTTKDVGKGTGLGLAVALGIVENHTGFIDVQTRPGGGTSVRVYLPAVLEANVIEAEPEQVAPLTSGSGETILLIEDEITAREITMEFLVKRDYRVLTAGDGEEAVRMFHRYSGEISLVLSDLGLPKCDGEEVCRQIRKVNASVPIIVASGYIESAKRKALSALGVECVINKPYRLTELLFKIKELIEGKDVPGSATQNDSATPTA
jgi:CheY-like chemotaxis protein